jgi:hypothetical protein
MPGEEASGEEGAEIVATYQAVSGDETPGPEASAFVAVSRDDGRGEAVASDETAGTAAVPADIGAPAVKKPGPARKLQSMDASGGSVATERRIQRRRPLPAEPVVTILVLGDPAIADPLGQELGLRFEAEGFEVGDARSSLAVNDLLRRWGGDVVVVDEILPALDAEGLHVLVLVEVERVGQRELRHLGGYSYATNARIRTRAFLLPAQRGLGRGWSEAVEYTDLTAEDRATKAEMGQDEIVAAIRDGWEELRRRGG